MSDGVEFGDLLRRCRVAAGLTQQALAERAELSLRGVSDLERGARRAPYRDTVLRLAAGLGLGQTEWAALLAASRRRPAVPSSLIGGEGALHASLSPAMPSGRDNLPLELTRFVGRQPEVAHVRQLLSEHRLVTLIGTGGVGKTRLATEVAVGLREVFADGVCMIELASLADPSLVPEAVAVPLDVRAEADVPLEQRLAQFLGPRRVLLALDNCEHLLEACARLATGLLRACPDLRILATSREPLRASGESAWRVPSLPVPPADRAVLPEHVLDYDAVRLFVDRASATGSFVLTDQNAPAVGRPIRRLDGIPLALELAAARVPSLGVVELSDRVDDCLQLLVDGSRTAPARQRTLEATVDWSYELLSEPERRLLERLSVYAGGFTAEAVEVMTESPDLEAESALSLLGHLVDKSLVVAETMHDGTLRYRLQEPVRQYAETRLERRGQVDTVRARHAAYYRELVRRAEPAVLIGERKPRQDRLELELDNLRATRAWLLGCGDVESLLRLNAYMFLLLAYRGYGKEGRTSLLQALAMPGGTPAMRARGLHCLALLAYLQADYAAAAEAGQQSLVIRQQIGDDAELAWSLLERATTATAQADLGVGGHLARQAQEVSRRSGQVYVLAYSLAMAGYVEYLEGELRPARQHATEALELGNAFGLVAPTSHALATLGEISYQESDLQTAALLQERALGNAKAPREISLQYRPTRALALIATDQGDGKAARRLLIGSMELAQRLGNPHRLAQSLETVAAFAARRGDLRTAWRLVDAAWAIRDRVGAPLSPTERRLLRERVGTPRSRAELPVLGEGQTLSTDEASTLAREFLGNAVDDDPAVRARAPSTSAAQADLAPDLSERQTEVLQLIACGSSNKEIATELVLSVRTVERHITNLYAKIGARGRADATAYAFQHSLLT